MKDYNKELVEMADSIYELATMICGHGYYACHNDDRDHPIPKAAIKEYLEMGASLARKQMMKEALEGVVVFDFYGEDDMTYGWIAHNSFCLEDKGLKDTDKVKLIIIMEDNK